MQDATDLNYGTLKHSTRGLTTIGGTATGICMHASLAVSGRGRPLGVLDLDGGFRAECALDDDKKESVR